MQHVLRSHYWVENHNININVTVTSCFFRKLLSQLEFHSEHKRLAKGHIILYNKRIRAQNDTLQPPGTCCTNFSESEDSMISVGCWFIFQFSILNLLYLVHDLVHIDAIAVSQLLKVTISALKHKSSYYNHIAIIGLSFFKELPESMYIQYAIC